MTDKSSQPNALLSHCEQYRFWLTRPSESLSPEKGAALFIMLNPSTADANKDDPTIRRCKGFVKSWECNGLTVGNLYALRAVSPQFLWLHKDPVGPGNNECLTMLMREHIDVVCAWGAAAKESRVNEFINLTKGLSIRLWCLGTTKNGAPRHPLYVKKNQELIRWEPSNNANTPRK